MKKVFLMSVFLCSIISFGQKIHDYQFTHIVNNDHTEVLSQGQTGTCWSFSTTSFLESEVKRITGKDVDLSEMYTVRMTYPEKAYNYVYRQGKAQFSEGGLGHDVLNAVAHHGVEPAEAYLGMKEGATTFDHSEMVKDLTSQLEKIVQDPKNNLKENWMNSIQSTLNKYMGEAPTKFTYEGKEFTPESFAKELKINPNDYVTLTSFTHHPFYSNFILEVPDNFSNGTYYNLPLDEYTETLNAALANGFTVSLDT